VSVLKGAIGCGLVLLSLGGPLRAEGQEVERSSPTNLQLYQRLASSIADSMAAYNPGSEFPSVQVVVTPADVRWFLEDPVARSFQARRWRVLVSDSARYAAELGALEMRVTYSNIRQNGLFGEKVMDRSARLVVRTRLVDRWTGQVVGGGERSAEESDSVSLSTIETMENQSIPSTHAPLPQEGFFSSWVEPLVVVCAVAVALFLLFTVRS